MDSSRVGARKSQLQRITRPTPDEIAAASGRLVPDLIRPDLKALFCGINPSVYTAAVGHHFARPGNRFWRALFDAGITDRLLAPHEEHILLSLGYGVERSGASLWVDGQLVIVDAPCSGVQMLWLGYFTACVVPLYAGRRDASFLSRLPAVSLLVLAGNVLRNAVLVALEASGRHPAGWLHEAVGLVVLAAVCGAIGGVMHDRKGARHV